MANYIIVRRQISRFQRFQLSVIHTGRQGFHIPCWFRTLHYLKVLGFENHATPSNRIYTKRVPTAGKSRCCARSGLDLLLIVVAVQPIEWPVRLMEKAKPNNWGFSAADWLPGPLGGFIIGARFGHSCWHTWDVFTSLSLCRLSLLLVCLACLSLCSWGLHILPPVHRFIVTPFFFPIFPIPSIVALNNSEVQ
mgnify:FL=1